MKNLEKGAGKRAKVGNPLALVDLKHSDQANRQQEERPGNGLNI